MENNFVIIGVLTAGTAAVIALFSKLIDAVKTIKSLRRELRRRVFVIAVVAPAKVPQCLYKFPDVTNPRDVGMSGETACVLHCTRLSDALKYGDDVCYKSGTDPKIHYPEDTEHWEAVACGMEARDAVV